MTELVITTDIEVRSEVQPEWESILSDEALGFVALLHKEFNPRRQELLRAREERKARLDAGEVRTLKCSSASRAPTGFSVLKACRFQRIRRDSSVADR